ncbi:zinc finger protein [Theobroma cacao]|nr:zinc finger protein [Theobroma cacao]
MHGQGSSSNSFSGNFYLNGGLGSDEHNVVPNASVHDGHTSMRWNGQSSSSLDTPNHVSFRQFLGDDFWLSPLGDQTGGQRFNPYLENVRLSTGNVVSTERGPIGPSFLPGQANSGPVQPNLDLNAAHEDEGNRIEASQDQDNGPHLSLNIFTAGAAAGDRIPPSGSSSSPVMIYSGIAGYVLEENISREGLPADGRRRLLCKRRAPEYSSGDNSSSTQQAGNFEQPAVTVTAQNNAFSSLTAASSFNNHLNSSHSAGLVAALPTPSNVHQIANEAAQVDNFQRNIRLRRTAGQQNSTPANLWPWNSSDSNVQVQTTGQSAVFSPFDRFQNTSLAPTPVSVTPAMQPIAQVSNSWLFPQPSQWNGPTMSWGASSSISPLREAFGQEENLTNNSRNMMIPLPNMPGNLNLASGNANFLGNIASSSRNQSCSAMEILPTSSIRSPQPNMVEYAQRLQEIVNRSEAWRQGNYCPIHSGASPAVRDMDLLVRGGNARPAQVPLRLGSRTERQAGRHSEVSPTAPSQTAAQRRSRLVSEVRNALGLVRRAGGLRLEDVMVIDRSVLYGVPGAPDVHDAMRLDVDNMSYEELLELEEQMGSVCTGLSDEAIMANLRRRKYLSITTGPTVEAEPCCICQEDYVNGEELGKLDCGHDFHFNCIKQWLVQKNSCPICKKTALAI